MYILLGGEGDRENLQPAAVVDRPSALSSGEQLSNRRYGMRRLAGLLLVSAVGAVALLVVPGWAGADHNTRPSENLRALGHSPHPATFLGTVSALREVNSDLAFWGKHTFNGNYDGFRIIRNSPRNPKEINWTHCNGDQGDIVVWGDILVRGWNSPAPEDNPATPVQENRFCDGEPVPVGFEGMHIFDISDRKDTELIGSVELSERPEASESGGFTGGCGTHTLTAVPDLANDRLLIYNQTSLGPCPFVSIIEVPLDDPASARWLRNEPLMDEHAHTHDTGVILGDVNLMAVASHTEAHVFDVGDNPLPGGSLEDPEFLYTIQEPGVCHDEGEDPQRPCNGFWHSATFTWDGEVIILGWEPGGGSEPECEATDPDVKKSAFFYDADTGEKLGQWTLPRPQIGREEATPEAGSENCTIHNYNTVPTRDGSHILVGGHYQAGTWVVDFSDPANPETLGFADPDPLPQVLAPATATEPEHLVDELGGAWSSYWYNGLIYESEITKGLNLFKYTGKETRKAIRLKHLNPQTQEFSLDGKKDDDRGDDDDDDDDDDRGKGKGKGRGDRDDDD
jgi:hypothetical protein